MSELVKKLSACAHDVEVHLYPERTVSGLKECIDNGYVHVRFPNTRGGTTLGVTLDDKATDLSSADFVNATGRVTLVGDLVLDYVPVTCKADIDLQTLTGTGRLEVRSAS
jgi:hypothetical protein